MLSLLAVLVACGREEPAAPVREPSAPLFKEVAATAGIDFVHRNGATGEFYLPELMHSGAAFVDINNDSFLDVYLIQAGPLPARPGADPGRNRLYLNRRDGTFVDVTSSSGLGDPGYGAGVAVADFDGDGSADIYVTNWGPNGLYRNNGDGTFSDITDSAGVGDPGYSSSAAFLDYDRDGDLDLYVANYVDWNPQVERPCFGLSGIRGYCAPDVYERPQRDTLYRNNGDSTFTDVSREAGIHSRAAMGLGVVTADFDRDGWPDVYVANDRMANTLWINQRDGTLADEALLRGAAVNIMGQAEAGMGVVVADLDANGFWDLFVAHLGGETNTFYANDAGLFTDRTDRLALGAVSRAYTGFGTALFDYDCDGHKDLFLANGRVRLGDSLAVDSYAEPNQLLRGRADGSFEEVSSDAGPGFELLEVSRGAAFGDYDNDGDIDILVSNNNAPARLLRNETTDCGSSLTVQLVGTRSDSDSIGAEIVAEVAGRRRYELVSPAYSYGSSNDPRVHIALSEGEAVDRLTVTFPSGVTRTLTGLAGGSILQVREPDTAAPAGR
ncbi:MAG: CRTAC1 family protein [Thermoanaerobaculia bacterium]